MTPKSAAINVLNTVFHDMSVTFANPTPDAELARKCAEWASALITVASTLQKLNK